MPRTPVQAVAFLLGFWIALALSPLALRVAAAEGHADLSGLEAALHERVQAVRASHRLIPFERLPALDAVARAHSADMARRGYVSHESPEGDNPLERIRGAGVAGLTLAAENIGRTTAGNPSESVVAGWLGSSEHRRNLLLPSFNRTGIGVARDPDGALLFTQLYITVPRP